MSSMLEERLSLREAAFLVDEPIKRVRKAAQSKDKGLEAVKPLKGQTSGREQRVPLMGAVLYKYMTQHNIQKAYRKAITREALYRLRKKQRGKRLSVDVSDDGSMVLSVDLKDTWDQIIERKRELNRIKKTVEGPKEDPLIKKTDIPVYRVAALVPDDGNLEQAKEAFPSLTEQQIEDAVTYMKTWPKSGHPYPSTSLKRQLKELGSLPFDENEEGAIGEIYI